MPMSWGQLSTNLTINSFRDQIPFVGQFELTTRCNFGCRMCYACSGINYDELKIRELSARQWIHMAEEARDAGMLFLLLTGGEIFYREDFREIYEEINRMGFVLSLYSNGSLITDQVIHWLERKPPSQIDISLYGASAETYKRVCGNPDGFQNSLSGIKRLKAAGIEVQIRTTVIKENIGDVDKMIELADDLGLMLNIVDYVSPGRDTGDKDTGRLSPKEQVQLLKKMETYFNQAEEKIKTDELHENKESYLKSLECLQNCENTGAFPCSSGKNTFFISWDGRMLPCPTLSRPLSYPITQGFSNAWKDLSAKCLKVPACKTCNKCSLKDYCITCPGRLFNETGSFKEPAPYLCELTRESIKNLNIKENEHEELYQTNY